MPGIFGFFQLHLLAVLLLALIAAPIPTLQAQNERQTQDESSNSIATAVLGGGCFWCVESDFERAPGVVDVVSGYSGGRTKRPTYKTYASAGHREVVLVTYDSAKVTFAGLVEWLVKHIDPTDRTGSFKDRGIQYSPVVYYANTEEKQAAELVVATIDDWKVYRGKVGIAIEPRQEFWPAEEEHQNYHSKNSVKYGFFRLQSGRDAFVMRALGARANVLELPQSLPPLEDAPEMLASNHSSEAVSEQPWLKFVRPSPLQLKRSLTAIQYKVTQQNGTEPAFRNPFWNTKDEGIYVDVVSGEPLFSSYDKFDSGTGWPSFVRPIAPQVVTYREESSFFTTKIEVRSAIAGSHLGHVFSDGPVNRGGKRYCMNSAALRFIPKAKLADEGYAEYVKLFEESNEM